MADTIDKIYIAIALVRHIAKRYDMYNDRKEPGDLHLLGKEIGDTLEHLESLKHYQCSCREPTWVEDRKENLS
jgi:hypothetical protein